MLNIVFKRQNQDFFINIYIFRNDGDSCLIKGSNCLLKAAMDSRSEVVAGEVGLLLSSGVRASDCDGGEAGWSKVEVKKDPASSTLTSVEGSRSLSRVLADSHSLDGL